MRNWINIVTQREVTHVGEIGVLVCESWEKRDGGDASITPFSLRHFIEQNQTNSTVTAGQMFRPQKIRFKDSFTQSN